MVVGRAKELLCEESLCSYWGMEAQSRRIEVEA
jgi:hypothetical protein